MKIKKIIVLFLTLSLLSCKKTEITKTGSTNIGTVINKQIVIVPVANDTLYKISIKNDETGNVVDYFANTNPNWSSFVIGVNTNQSFKGIAIGQIDSTESPSEVFQNWTGLTGTSFQSQFPIGSVYATCDDFHSLISDAISQDPVTWSLTTLEVYNSTYIGQKQSLYKTYYIDGNINLEQSLEPCNW